MNCVAKRYFTCGPFIRTERDENDLCKRIIYRVDSDGSDDDETTQPKEKIAVLVEPLHGQFDPSHPKAGDWIVESVDSIDWMPEHEFRQKYTIIGER